jgi:hypothetical protein
LTYFTDLAEWPEAAPLRGHRFEVGQHDRDDPPGDEPSYRFWMGAYSGAVEAVAGVASLTKVHPVEWELAGDGSIISRERGSCGEHARWQVCRRPIPSDRWYEPIHGMVKADRFAVSRRPYAVKLDTFRGGGMCSYQVEAAWFQRKNGVDAACIGRLSGGWPGDGEPDVLTWLDWLDGRYGGDCFSRWNRRTLWTACSWEAAQRHRSFLDSMLDAYGEVPAGYDGWWEFRKRA